MKKTIEEIKKSNLTYLSETKLNSLYETCLLFEKEQIQGDFIECGAALGGSGILITKIKNYDRKLKIYDVFEKIPAPTDKDGNDSHERYKKILMGDSRGIGSGVYYGYQDNLLDVVKNNFSSFGIDYNKENVSFIKGDITKNLDIESSVAFAHIDVDWYEPVKTSLEKIYPKLVIMGTIIVDDYYDWAGCRKAVDEFLFDKRQKVILDASKQTMKITKIRE